jgi:ABC-type lipoprotein release transport system permease subunit
MGTPTKDLFKVSLYDKYSRRFLYACIGSFSFSIAVILGTIGLMDGFEQTLKKSLLKSNGHINLVSRDGFFFFDSKLRSQLQIKEIKEASPIIQTQGFLIKGELSKGVLIKGVEPKAFERITSLKLSNLSTGIGIGKELAKQMRVSLGDQIILALAKGNDNIRSLPKLLPFKIESIIDHGIYEKDLRFVYMPKEILAEVVHLTNRNNIISVKLHSSNSDHVKSVVSKLNDELGEKFKVKPYWSEFYGLLKAVEIEKLTITLVLQIIVLISVFNIAAFVIFISEKKSQDLFLIQAIGAGPKAIKNFWYLFILSLWILSCILSVGLVHFFNFLLSNIEVFQIPGEIYVLSELNISLDPIDYLGVFLLTLGWMLLIGYFSIRRMSKKTILSGLRQEFS